MSEQPGPAQTRKSRPTSPSDSWRTMSSTTMPDEPSARYKRPARYNAMLPERPAVGNRVFTMDLTDGGKLNFNCNNMSITRTYATNDIHRTEQPYETQQEHIPDTHTTNDVHMEEQFGTQPERMPGTHTTNDVHTEEQSETHQERMPRNYTVADVHTEQQPKANWKPKPTFPTPWDNIHDLKRLPRM